MTLVTIIGIALVILGLWGMLTQRNLIKIIIGFSIIDTGIHLIIVSIGYIKGKTAPIIDSPALKADAVNKVVDPIPSALVLTAIVIGLAVTALMLVYAVNLYQRKQSLDINDFKELKW
ncbi:MAG: NADH-quinone oxidoreductase subunit K [Candidatus Marinimicrobia bacterium]|nr:NADH-quinone oxidoreductase subunit K [Candidatus Neomarinimicrobiota bacterium]RKY55229.1 MAG: cation:proton antiporter [Candidatus Neomarinimicrobiota bacterium]